MIKDETIDDMRKQIGLIGEQLDFLFREVVDLRENLDRFTEYVKPLLSYTEYEQTLTRERNY